MSGDPADSALAHVTEEGFEHRLSEHLRDVGELAGRFAAAFGAEEQGRLAGRWHDVGKYSAAFQAMIREANGVEAHVEGEVQEAPDPARKRVDHSSAGALLAFEQAPESDWLQFVIAGHHAGLANVADLKERLQRQAWCLGEARRGSTYGQPAAALLAEEIPALPDRYCAQPDSRQAREALDRRYELWIRMVFSALCDADFLDTERFYNERRSQVRETTAGLSVLRDALDRRLVALEATAAAGGETEVHRVRREVRVACERAASWAPGVLSLTVPTGGGKTLASMTFALRHALANGLRRVVVAIPYTSIIEQSAEVYRDAFGDALRDAVIEHHSATDPRRETWRNRVASENWDAPVVVTTTAQLFDSLFASRTSRCRKLHNLARSVIVLDEAQTLPPALLPTILDGLQTLVDDFGASVVLCTATQPALDRRRALPCGLTGRREIVSSDLAAHQRLRRVNVAWPDDPDEPRPWVSLGGEVATHDDVLVIVHQRTDARTLCATLDARLGHTETLHLSALMCPEHRSRCLAGLKARRARREPARVVSTQLVEAGVDLDFPVVFRALAGMDSLAQAAGRCNREGRLAPGRGRLVVFRAPTPPPPGVLREALDVTLGMLVGGTRPDLFDPATHERFFRRLYKRLEVESDPLGLQAMRAALRFRDVAERFHLIDNDWSAPVVVPYGDAAAHLAALEAYGPTRATMRGLQRLMVNVPRRARDAWIAGGRARWVHDVVVALEPGLEGAYDPRFGLDLDAVSAGVWDAATLVVDG